MSSPVGSRRAVPRVFAVLALIAVVALASCSSDTGSDASASRDKGSKVTTTTTASKSEDDTSPGSGSGDVSADKGKDGKGGDDGGRGTRGGADTKEGKAYVTAVEDQLRASSFDITDEQGQCVAPKWVDAMGVKTLEDHQIETGSLADPTFQFSVLQLKKSQTDDMIAALAACGVDVKAEFIGQISGLTKEEQDCMARELQDQTVLDMLSTTMRNGEPESDGPIAQELQRVSAACHLQDGSGAGTDGGTGTGN